MHTAAYGHPASVCTRPFLGRPPPRPLRIPFAPVFLPPVFPPAAAAAVALAFAGADALAFAGADAAALLWALVFPAFPPVPPLVFPFPPPVAGVLADAAGAAGTLEAPPPMMPPSWGVVTFGRGEFAALDVLFPAVVPPLVLPFFPPVPVVPVPPVVGATFWGGFP